MRKNAIRKILHGILDLLPLLVIPTFMIYARNENSSFGSEVTVTQSKIVNFNQLINNGLPTSTASWNIHGDCSLKYEDNSLVCYDITSYTNFGLKTNINNTGRTGHKVLIRFNGQTIDDDVSNNFRIRWPFVSGNGTLTNNLTTFTFIGTWGASSGDTLLIQCISGGYDFSICDIMLVDLTQMFGLGNEPTVEEFNQWFPDPYYNAGSGENYLIEDYSTITYNDTDIGSQMVYVLYNTVDKYFNMNNVFGMNNVYSWFELNIFGGTAPLAIYIVWNIVLYEFVMDLLMLLYGLFMWFIDMIKSLMEKPINAIK